MATYSGIASVHFLDSYGIPGEFMVNIEIDGTQTIDSLATDIASLNTAVTPLSQATNPSTTVKIDFSGAGGTAAGDIEKGGLFNFANSFDIYSTGLLVPDVNPAVLNSSGLIDLTNTDVTAFVTFITTAHTVITVVTKGLRALTSLRDALIAFRKHRKPLSRKTKEV